MSLLLDTNACIAVIKGSPLAVRSRLVSAHRSGKQVFLTSIVLYELYFGVAKTRPDRHEENAAKLKLFLESPFPVLPFTAEDSEIAAKVRADLERVGEPIGAYDLLIAAQAINNRLTLITANESEFSRVSGLQWRNWAR